MTSCGPWTFSGARGWGISRVGRGQKGAAAVPRGRAIAAGPAIAGPPPGAWLPGDLHAHTVHSDGLETVAAVVARARAAGLAFLAITDHNTVAHHAAMAALPAPGLVLIPGQEVTTPLGHLNVWGAAPLDGAACRTEADMATIVTTARQAGAVCSINHPKTLGPPWQYGLGMPVDAIEVWQTHWACRNAESLALWDTQLAVARRLTAVGGSDFHGPLDPVTALRRIGWPTTWVRARAHTPTAILEAIRCGRTCISAHPAGPRVDLTAQTTEARVGVGDVLRVDGEADVEVVVSVAGGAGGVLQIIGEAGPLHAVPIDRARFAVRCRLTAKHFIRAEVLGNLPRPLRLDRLPAGWDEAVPRQAVSGPIYIHSSAR